MAGLGAVFAVGALGGVGDALVEQARQKREEALAELKRQQQLEDYQMRRNDGLADYQMQRRDSLADEQRGIQREDDRINRTAEAYRASTFSGDQAEFVSAIMPHAERVGREIGVAPEIIIAQAALESGWGRSAPGNNFFGIKSHGKSGGQTLATNEVINGQTVRINDSFRQYEDIGQSVEDYGRFLRENPRYREMLQAGDIDAQIEALGRSGYATDPQYAAKVRQIAGVVQKMDPQIWRTLADPSTPAAIRDDIRQNVGLGGVTKERAMKEDSRGVLRYVDTGAPVFEDDQPKPADEYERYAQEERDAGREPLSRIDYAQAKRGSETVFGPDGNPIIVRGGSDAVTKFTEGQSKDNVFVTRAEGALSVLEPVANTLTSRQDRILDYVPLGLGREAQGSDYQVAQQSGDEFLQAILRKDTGAAITEGEQVLYGSTYLPKPGDSEAVLAAKRASRVRAVEAIKAGMSPAQMVAQERALRNTDERLRTVFGGDAPAAPQATPTAPGASGNLNDARPELNSLRSLETKNFGAMSIVDLARVDQSSLSTEQLDAYIARLEEIKRTGR